MSQLRACQGTTIQPQPQPFPETRSQSTLRIRHRAEGRGFTASPHATAPADMGVRESVGPASGLLHQGAKVLSWLEGRPAQRAKDRFLQENFGPVRAELHQQDLEVEGHLPAALNGAFARNGPNPYFDPTGGYHWFDGDGMMHVVRIKDGKATYCNRFVDTLRLQHEKAAGHPVSIKIGDLRGTQSLFHVAGNAIRGALPGGKVPVGTGNTALVFHAKKLLALHEADCPYYMRVMCDGILETMQRYDYEGKLEHCFTAHPKIDPDSGHMYFFGYSNEKPHVQYSVADEAGAITHQAAFNLREPIMMHDFAVTQDYAVFLDVPLCYRPQEMITKNLSTALPWHYHPKAGARIGLLPKYAQDASQPRWFDLPGFFAFHTANAWQEGPLVHLFVAAFDQFDLDFWNAGGRFPDTFPRDGQAYLSEIVLNTETGEATRHRVTQECGEFPSTAQHVSGRKCHYIYMPVNDDSKANAQSGAIKVDVGSSSRDVVGRLSFGYRCFGGELIFVPRQQNPAALQGEDDGYLMTYIYDEPKQKSFFVVYDAHTMSSQPVARVALPQRVPFGFHGIHVTEQQLQSQEALSSSR